MKCYLVFLRSFYLFVVTFYILILREFLQYEIYFSIGIWWLCFLSWSPAGFEHINFNCLSYTFITFLDYFFLSLIF